MDARSISWRDGVVKYRARKMLSAPGDTRQALDEFSPTDAAQIARSPVLCGSQPEASVAA